MSNGKDEQKAQTENSKERARLPFLLNLTFTLAQLFVVLLGLLTSAISFLSGATLFWAVARGGVAMLSVGLVFWLVNYLLARGGLAAIRQEIMKEMEKANARETASTVEKTA